MSEPMTVADLIVLLETRCQVDDVVHIHNSYMGEDDKVTRLEFTREGEPVLVGN